MIHNIMTSICQQDTITASGLGKVDADTEIENGCWSSSVKQLRWGSGSDQLARCRTTPHFLAIKLLLHNTHLISCNVLLHLRTNLKANKCPLVDLRAPVRGWHLCYSPRSEKLHYSIVRLCIPTTAAGYAEMSNRRGHIKSNSCHSLATFVAKVHENNMEAGMLAGEVGKIVCCLLCPPRNSPTGLSTTRAWPLDRQVRSACTHSDRIVRRGWALGGYSAWGGHWRNHKFNLGPTMHGVFKQREVPGPNRNALQIMEPAQTATLQPVVTKDWLLWISPIPLWLIADSLHLQYIITSLNGAHT